MNKEQFMRLMEPLVVAFIPGLEKKQIDVYYNVFQDCEIDIFEEAVKKTLWVHKFPDFPKPGVIAEQYDIAKKSPKFRDIEIRPGFSIPRGHAHQLPNGKWISKGDFQMMELEQSKQKLLKEG